MAETIKLKAIIFGYDTLIKEGEEFVSLRGEATPELSKGMKVVLLGDSQGYVPSHFKPGEEVTIVGFTKPFERGESDNIVEVTNGQVTGWVKPSNIQKNIVESKGDPTYRRIRRAVEPTFAEFMDSVYLSMPEAERRNLPSETGPFVNAITAYALQRLETFGEQLASVIATVYEGSPSGERFIRDPVRTNAITDAMLYLDNDGQIISIRNPQMVLMPPTNHLHLKQFESYEVLTGRLKGKRFFSNTHPVGEPAYHPGVVASGVTWFNCFISHSTKDKEFAERLYEDLMADGIRCWYAPHDVRGGQKLSEQITDAIRSTRRLLLILSDDSMNSEWVKTEIANAREREIQEKRQMLFPISLVPYDRIKEWKAFDAETGKDSAREIREYFIPDFSSWKDRDSYQQAFQGLLRDLKAEGGTGGSGR